MKEKPTWLNDSLEYIYHNFASSDNVDFNAYPDTLKLNRFIINRLFFHEKSERVLSKISKIISEKDTCEMVGNHEVYFFKVSKAFMRMYFENEFTTKAEKKVSKEKVLKACDDILENMGKITFPIIDVYIRADKDTGTIGSDDSAGDIKTFMHVADVLNAIKEKLSVEQRSVLKRKTRDSKFNLFCRLLYELNVSFLGQPYWEGIAFFAYQLIRSAPKREDKITAVRNACGLRG